MLKVSNSVLMNLLISILLKNSAITATAVSKQNASSYQRTSKTRRENCCCRQDLGYAYLQHSTQRCRPMSNNMLPDGKHCSWCNETEQDLMTLG